MLLPLLGTSLAGSLLWAQLRGDQCAGPLCYLTSAATIALLHAVCMLVYHVVLYPNHLSPLRYLPSPKQPPFTRRLLTEPDYDELIRWINEIPNDGLIRYYGFLNAERILVTTPQGCKEVLQTQGYNYIKLPWALEIMGQFGPQGILVAPPKKHRVDRKLLQPAFKFKYIKELSPIFWTEGAKFLTAIEKQLYEAGNGLIDIGERLHHCTLDIITLTAFGASIHAVDDPNSRTVKHFRNLFASKKEHLIYRFTAFLLPSWLYRRLPVKAKNEIMMARNVIADFIRPLIHERRATASKTEDKQYAQGDVIATLLQSGEEFSDDYLIDQSMDFMVAGQETTATAVALTLYSLSEHPEIQQRLREEVRAKLPSPSSSTQVDAVLVESLPYLVAVCNEVLRLYSPVVYCHRQTIAPNTTIGGVSIPLDTVVTVAPGLIHESRKVWGPKANEFDPERWLVRNAEEVKIDPLGGTNDTYAVMPFTYGPRQCIGERFARGEMLSLVAQLVGRFDWKFKGIGRRGDRPMKIVHAVVAGPVGGGMTIRILGGHSPSLGNGIIWGRTGVGRTWLHSLMAASPVVLAPLASISVFITLAAFDGSFSSFAEAVSREGFWSICMRHGPQLTAKGVLAVIGWVGLQALLFLCLPGKIRTGQYTPAGHLLSYRMNGLGAWAATHVLYVVLCWMGLLDPGFIPRNWSSLIAAMNLAGLLISALAFIKAYVMPTHPDDRRFSGSSIYDFYMGIELNPQLGDSFDLKLFSNGRPGIIAGAQYRDGAPSL
ncbi:Cytochrome P450 monooxygenase FSL4 [Paramyrothecium foliicola]|nr:Cytochrome P450 monooxygenase FSL4 [Paramyrothecium foliicola]